MSVVINLDLSKDFPTEKQLRCNNSKYDFDRELGRYYVVGDKEKRPIPERVKTNDNSKMKFGKYKGMKLGDVPDDYLAWMLENMKNLDMEFEEYIRDRF